MPKKIDAGKELTELVKGSLNYTMHVIRAAFYSQFSRDDDDWFWVEEIFADHVIVKSESQPPDEYYQVSYSGNASADIEFAPRNEWQVVELSYRPQSALVAESNRSGTISNGEKARFTERVTSAVSLDESSTDSAGPWRISGLGITADIVNGNGRRYARHVLEAAVRDAKLHLNESAGQGRIVLTGESDHPADKGNRAPLLQETIIVWDDISLTESRVLISGNLIGTQLGRDTRTQMQAGIKPDISQRGYGRSVVIEENGQRIEEVLDLVITGYDLVADGSDPNAGVTMIESKKQQPTGDLEMSEAEEKLRKIKEQQRRAVYEFVVARVSSLTRYSESVRKQLQVAVLSAEPENTDQATKLIEERCAEYDAIASAQAASDSAIRAALGLSESDDISEAIARREAERKALSEADQQRKVSAYVAEQIGKTEWPSWAKDQCQNAIDDLAPQTVEEAKKILSAKTAEYNGIMAGVEQAARGYGVNVLGPILERDTGTPAFAQASFEIVERLVERNLTKRRDFRAPKSPGEVFTAQYLEHFDRAYRPYLVQESRLLSEAESTTDLNLPYSVARAIIEEATPQLVALSVFDFALTDTSPTRIYFENYAAETGASATITDESFTSSHDAWVSLAHKRLRTTPAVVVTSSPAGTTYTEGTDFVVDYGNGKIMVLSTGTMADATAFLIDYTYDSVREGELTAIQRGKGQLTYQTIDLAADRLATQVSDEAVTFARTQLGWDAQARTINMLVREIREMIDNHIFRLAIASATRSGNSGGTWTSATDTLLDLVDKLGLAKVAVKNSYYMPEAYVLSATNAQKLSMWDGFKRDGFPDAQLNAAGFVGAVNGLPVYESTEMPDNRALCVNRELVQHRVLSSKPMSLKGPYPAYSGGNLVAASEWFVEEYNATESLVPAKGGYVIIA